MNGVIGVVIGLIIGLLFGSIAFLIGWSEGWDDCKEFTYAELDKRSDEQIVFLVRMMAEKLKGGKDDKS